MAALTIEMVLLSSMVDKLMAVISDHVDPASLSEIRKKVIKICAEEIDTFDDFMRPSLKPERCANPPLGLKANESSAPVSEEPT